jgi:argininosuccinate lyase
VVGKSVAYGIQKQKDLSELSLEELQTFDASIENDVFDILSLEGSLLISAVKTLTENSGVPAKIIFILGFFVPF